MFELVASGGRLAGSGAPGARLNALVERAARAGERTRTPEPQNPQNPRIPEPQTAVMTLSESIVLAEYHLPLSSTRNVYTVSYSALVHTAIGCKR